MTPPVRDDAPQVETLQERLRSLLREREALRATGAASDDLERNRRDIVETQWKLSHALIERHRPSFQPA